MTEEPKDLMDAMLEDPVPGTGTVLAPGGDGGSAMAPYQNQASFDPEDVYIPNLRLAQGLTPEVQNGDARPGQWLLTGFEPQAEVVIVPLAFFKRRELRDEDTREILCSSQDAVVGVGTPGGTCVECPLSKWTGDGDNRKGPVCSFSYEYVVYSDTHQAMALLKFTRTGVKAGKTMNTAVAQVGLGKLAFRLRADQKQGPRGAFFAPNIAPTRVEPTVLEAARGKFEQAI